jgi:hypothetical protein
MDHLCYLNLLDLDSWIGFGHNVIGIFQKWPSKSDNYDRSCRMLFKDEHKNITFKMWIFGQSFHQRESARTQQKINYFNFVAKFELSKFYLSKIPVIPPSSVKENRRRRLNPSHRAHTIKFERWSLLKFPQLRSNFSLLFFRFGSS